MGRNKNRQYQLKVQKFNVYYRKRTTKQNGSSSLRPSPQTTDQNLVSRRYGPSWTHNC